VGATLSSLNTFCFNDENSKNEHRFGKVLCRIEINNKMDVQNCPRSDQLYSKILVHWYFGMRYVQAQWNISNSVHDVKFVAYK
jgi:hypothetical protein